ncbi:Gamma-glutamylputrescine synthetase PuuA [Aliiroseovarius sp. xm-m-379]|uniref:glutamine synthetase family protein n=1 Tax=unclassified Aliiroseovarius TaxID=2623558 RepID=UPI00156A1A70|nr:MULTISPECIES: glutamine synthetase family protein [unclassified Aliiroseovarius]NRP11384.1 Gamma-glutamylputrescine synthetase PuuA [Aliiroseovarius sp. xm-d-517]NRP23877.1 Gamma-glutamylputrescine synthetase PuuA [Aliiroseovarius sp. xm-m-379]NRP28876.1 Gamma-glutamylputrescine synthetase PuuA [Aliiroseovarius sp. xm-m-314]NRP32676.1 Gamma-glutamylputrescine synthetase PuuA [Aliiroseovarius sp. xm-a-104]NRP42232.1 Gamma-glutamylputrescine synthetase PuuA [Aliiroseovarius sp. xm-m-339-2]
MSDFLTEYAAYCDQHGRPERIELMLCDVNAVLRGKWLPGDDEKKLAEGMVRLPISTYAANILGAEVSATGLGIVVGDPDGRIVPIPGTMKPVPWAKGKMAQIQVEMLDPETGELSELSSRKLLSNMVDRFHEKGWHPVLASELEFYLIQPRNSEDEAPTPPVRSPDAQNYDLEVLERMKDVLDEILEASAIQGLATDTLIAEYGPGQFEVNFHHTDDVLKAADTALLFKRLVRGVARNHGLEATFMAKPYADFPGNGMHLHASVVDADGKNIFDDGSPKASDTLRAAVGGTLETMRDLQAIFAPHLNSYRRYRPMSFAPSAPDWGYDNRAAGVRLPEIKGPAARLEHRIAGADVNPYLVITAILGGMLHGLETKPDLPLPLDDPNAETAPRLTADWIRAVDRFSQSDIAAEIFGKRYRDIYSAIRLDEIDQLTNEISQVEYRAYLGRL